MDFFSHYESKSQSSRSSMAKPSLPSRDSENLLGKTQMCVQDIRVDRRNFYVRMLISRLSTRVLSTKWSQSHPHQSFLSQTRQLNRNQGERAWMANVPTDRHVHVPSSTCPRTDMSTYPARRAHGPTCPRTQLDVPTDRCTNGLTYSHTDLPTDRSLLG